MPPLPHRSVLVAALALTTAFVGCAHKKKPPPPVMVRPAPLPPPPPPPPPPQVVHVVVLPLDKGALPEMADEINDKLGAVKLADATDTTTAAVSMETAQMQSECAEPTDGCYLRVARLLEADRMLWAQVERIATKAPKRKKAKPIIKLQMFLFDRDKLGVTGQAAEEFAGPITAADIDRLIASTIGEQAAAPEPTPTYPAQPPASPAATPTYAPTPSGRGAATPPAPGRATTASPPAAAPAPAYPAPAAAPPAAAPAPAYPGPAAAPPPAAAPAYPGPAAAPPPASPPPASFPPASAPAAPPRMQ